MLATKLQLAGFDISRSGVSKIEARLCFVDDKDHMFLVEALPSRCYHNESLTQAVLGLESNQMLSVVFAACSPAVTWPRWSSNSSPGFASPPVKVLALTMKGSARFPSTCSEIGKANDRVRDRAFCCQSCQFWGHFRAVPCVSVQISGLPVQALFLRLHKFLQSVRDTRFKPVTPTVSRYSAPSGQRLLLCRRLHMGPCKPVRERKVLQSEARCGQPFGCADPSTGW
jgi:hypothetical protein